MCPFSKKYPEFPDKYLIAHLIKPKKYSHFIRVTLRTDCENCTGTFELLKITLDRKSIFDDFMYQKTQNNSLCLDECLRSKVYEAILNEVGNINFSVSEISFKAQLNNEDLKVVIKIYR